MKKIKDISEVLNSFEQAAIAHTYATENGDYRTANKNYGIIVKMVNLLKDRNQIHSLVPFLDHNCDGVKVWAASYLLTTEEILAITTLERVALKKEKGLIRLNAETTLSEWRKGNLKL